MRLVLLMMGMLLFMGSGCYRCVRYEEKTHHVQPAYTSYHRINGVDTEIHHPAVDYWDKVCVEWQAQ